MVTKGLVEAGERLLPRGAQARRQHDGHRQGHRAGRGVFRRRAALRRPVRARALGGHALAEAGILGTAMSVSAWRGSSPICECSSTRSGSPCLDQLVARTSALSVADRRGDGRSGHRSGAVPRQHQRPRAPRRLRARLGVRAGVKVAIPSTPADAKGLLAAAIRDPDPVVVLEPKLHYRTLRGDVPEGEHVVPLGRGAARARGERPDARRLRLDDPGVRSGGRSARSLGRGAGHPNAEAARRGRPCWRPPERPGAS